jgi:t-SNARE complex subunit (syntaxin)
MTGGTAVMEKKHADLLKQVERVGKTGLGKKLDNYREQRKAYEGAVHGKNQQGATLPAQRESGAGPARRRAAGSFVGDRTGR